MIKSHCDLNLKYNKLNLIIPISITDTYSFMQRINMSENKIPRLMEIICNIPRYISDSLFFSLKSLM